MTLKDILERCQNLKVEQKRSISDEYCEFVISGTDIEQWKKIFDEVFGLAQKKEGQKPTKEHLSLTENYGGIAANQILYKRDFDDGILLAMFWPWNDGSFVTLKLIHLKK